MGDFYLDITKALDDYQVLILDGLDFQVEYSKRNEHIVEGREVRGKAEKDNVKNY